MDESLDDEEEVISKENGGDKVLLVCRVKFCIAFLFGILIFLKYSIFFYVYFFGDEFL